MINIKLNSSWKDYDLSWSIKKSLIQSTLIVQWRAVKNAPYVTWNLRRSITTKVKKDEWIVWTNVPYARVREYVNKKNPSRKFYMKRALESSERDIEKIFTKNLNNVFND